MTRQIIAKSSQDYRKAPAAKCLSPGTRLAVLGVFAMAAAIISGCAATPAAAPAPAPTSAQAGATTIVAVAAPAGPAFPTLPEFLGLDKVCQGVGAGVSHVRNSLGTFFPGLEAKPGIRALTDPGENPSPAEATAAEAKAEEDKAPQKVKALKFLASRGCGSCYPDTEKALIAAMEDCTEVVRYAAVNGLRRSLGGQCRSCRENSCCTPKLTKKLGEIVFEMDDQGCYKESSSRVRRLARLVLQQCGGIVPVQTGEAPDEGPTRNDGPPSQETLPEPNQPTAVGQRWLRQPLPSARAPHDGRFMSSYDPRVAEQPPRRWVPQEGPNQQEWQPMRPQSQMRQRDAHEPFRRLPAQPSMGPLMPIARAPQLGQFQR